jgi:hypothetical protein|tara:strand:+ start:1252 stop:1419 length:168 start_codon:yes stop_codon:yes gene_type:complete
MDVNDMIDYFEIKLDESGKKRVVELSALRDEAEMKGDTSKLALIDSELNTIYGEL